MKIIRQNNYVVILFEYSAHFVRMARAQRALMVKPMVMLLFIKINNPLHNQCERSEHFIQYLTIRLTDVHRNYIMSKLRIRCILSASAANTLYNI